MLKNKKEDQCLSGYVNTMVFEKLEYFSFPRQEN